MFLYPLHPICRHYIYVSLSLTPYMSVLYLCFSIPYTIYVGTISMFLYPLHPVCRYYIYVSLSLTPYMSVLYLCFSVFTPHMSVLYLCFSIPYTLNVGTISMFLCPLHHICWYYIYVSLSLTPYM